VALAYPGGSNLWCPPGRNRTLTIAIECAQVLPAETAFGELDIFESNSCDYAFTLASIVGCPTSCIAGDVGSGGAAICSGHGVCAGAGACICDEGFCGPLCSERVAPTSSSSTRASARAAQSTVAGIAEPSVAAAASAAAAACAVDFGNATFDLSSLTAQSWLSATDSSHNIASLNHTLF
jgi:hypothetical protein